MIETERVVAEASRDDGSPGKRTISWQLSKLDHRGHKIARKPIRKSISACPTCSIFSDSGMASEAVSDLDRYMAV
jgi:hypothetical protein